MVLLQLSSAQGPAECELAVTKALRSEYVETPVGKIKFDARGDAEGVGFAVYQVQDGKYVEVK